MSVAHPALPPADVLKVRVHLPLGPSPTRTVLVLGLAQTLAWASSYYLPAMLAAAMARDIGVAPSTVHAAFSLALVVSALVGPGFGRLIDRHGGRPVLMATSLLFAAGLIALSQAERPVPLFVAWALIGLAMGGGLYDAAFATLVRLQGQDARRAITGITLMAGFASTVGWPLSAWLEVQHGWRQACLVWAGLHLLVGLPLNALVPAARPSPGPSTAADPVQPQAAAPVERDDHHDAAQRRNRALLAVVFAATWFVSTAMAAHLPRLLQASGASLALAVAAAALVGPAQVAGRLLEYALLARMPALRSARLAALAHPLAAALLLLAGAPVAWLFALLHGAGNGILTIAKGTLPLVLFGPAAYGARQGWLMMPARVAQAFAPYLFGLALDRWGPAALGGSALVGALAWVALMRLRPVPLNAPAAPPGR